MEVLEKPQLITPAIVRDRAISRAAPLLLLLLAGTVVRLALWSHFQGVVVLHDDEAEYNAVALNLLHHGEFALKAGEPYSIRPPLYPAMVAALYRVLRTESPQVVRLFQATLSLLNVVVLYRLGSILYGRRVGLLTAALFCFYPSLLGFNNLLMSEVLYIFLLSCASYLLVRALRRDWMRDLVLAAAVLGLATLTRSVLWLFPLPMSVFLLFAWPGSFKRRAVAAAAFVTVFAATLAPWSIRNTRLEKTFVVVDTMGGRNFMMGNYRYTPLYRAWDAISLQGEQAWTSELYRDYPISARRTQGQLDALAMRRGISFVLHNPALTAERDAIKFYRFWGLERELISQTAHDYYGHFSTPAMLALTLVIFGSYATVIVAGIFGVFLTPPPDKRGAWCLLLIVGFVWGIHTVVFSHSRYHLPVLVLLLPFAAKALAGLKGIYRRKEARGFWLAAAVVALLAMSWLWEIVVIDGARFFQHLHLSNA